MPRRDDSFQDIEAIYFGISNGSNEREKSYKIIQTRREENAMKRGLVLLGIVALFVTVFFAHYGEAAEVLKIGVIGPMSGGLAYFGTNWKMGVDIAVSQINDRGGIEVAGKRYSLETVGYDDEAKAEKAVAGVRKLAALDRAPVIIGPLASGPTLAALGVNEKEKVLIFTTSTHPDVTRRGNKLVVRIPPTTDIMLTNLAKAAIRYKKWKNVAILAESDERGRSAAAIFTAAFNKVGGTILGQEFSDHRSTTDFYAQVTKMKALNPDVLMIIAHDEPASLIIKQAREVGWQGPFLFTESFHKKGIELAGAKNVEGALLIVGIVDLERPPYLKLRADFQVKFGSKARLETYSVISYDSTYIAAYAMQKAGTVNDAYKIREAVPKVIPFKESVYERTSVDETGQGWGPIFVGELRDGKPVVIAE
jgi:branched-chain amino acid transport system substrate-binding protein